MPASAEPNSVEPAMTGACGCVDPATPVVMLPPAAVAGDVVVCCELTVGVTMLAVLATVTGVLTDVVVMLSVMGRAGVEETKLLATVEPTAVVGVVVVF